MHDVSTTNVWVRIGEIEETVHQSLTLLQKHVWHLFIKIVLLRHRVPPFIIINNDCLTCLGPVVHGDFTKKNLFVASRPCYLLGVMANGW